jgi:hypothetical protein
MMIWADTSKQKKRFKTRRPFVTFAFQFGSRYAEFANNSGQRRWINEETSTTYGR